jgi:hypothetical protein
MKWEGLNLSTVVEVALGVLIATLLANLLFGKKKSSDYDKETYDVQTYEEDYV